MQWGSSDSGVVNPNSSISVLAVAGVTGSGKDTFYRLLAATCKQAVRQKFAYPLQDAVAVLGGFYDKLGGHRYWFEDQSWKDSCLVSLHNVKYDKQARAEVFAKLTNIWCAAPLDADYRYGKIELFNLSRRVVLGTKIYSCLDFWFDECFPEDAYTPREIQKRLGTDLMRKRLEPDLWVSCLARALKEVAQGSLVVITDVRFPNELELVRRYDGKLVYLKNEKAWLKAKSEGKLSHESELYNDYLYSNADWVYDNSGSLEELKKFVELLKELWWLSA